MREISPSDWAKVGRRLGLGAEAALIRVTELRDALPGALESSVASLPADTRDRAARLSGHILAHVATLPRQWS